MTSLTCALREALCGVEPADVLGGVLGIAGAGGAGRARAEDLANTAWTSAGLDGTPTVVNDIVIAFASGTVDRSGIVLIAGTGAVAAAISDGAVTERCDGYGWLLGDEGSAVWLGREGIRAALAAGDGRGEPTGLADAIPHALLGGHRFQDPADVAQAVVRKVYGGAPADVGGLAPVVCGQASAGDLVAQRLTNTAAERLLAAVDAVRPTPHGSGRVVLTGAVLTSGPVSDAVRTGLTERFGEPPADAQDGALGAAALATRAYGGAADAHARLLETISAAA